MAIHVALLLSLIESLALAGVLLVWARRVDGVRLLAGFLLGIAVWLLGNELPSLFGAVTERTALALLATAALTGATFFHFAAVFSATRLPSGALVVAYTIGGAATLLSIVFRPGGFEPFAGVSLMAVPNGVGWATSLTWGLLAGASLLMLLRAFLRRRGLARRQVAAIAASSAWGMLCMAGYGMVLLRLSAYPWPLLMLPAYPLILVYGILRWRVFVANVWARRALAWSMVTGLAMVIVAAVPALPVEGVAGRYLAGAIAAAACLTLAGPARQLAERLIYPGNAVTAGDIGTWRAILSAADSFAALAREARRMLSARLGVVIAVALADNVEREATPDPATPDPATPALSCTRGGSGWTVTLHGWDEAPPGARHLAELFGAVLAQEAERLERAMLLAERERERQTQERLAELGQLAATVAHDVRNPLNSIAMAAAGLPAQVRADIREQTDRIARLSQDLLDYARPWNAAPLPLDLREHVAAASRIWPEVELGDGLRNRVTVCADPGRLDQALGNLLDNARATGARVAVDAERADGCVRLHVCDAGPGVPRDLRERIFLPFVSRNPGGTGLGLAIVARIMAAHGGRALLTERPGWSTCVTLEFPA